MPCKGISCPSNRSKQIQQTQMAYSAGTQYTRQSLKGKQLTWLHSNYTPIAFDEGVTFWLQRAGSLPCACAFAALHACAIA